MTDAVLIAGGAAGFLALCLYATEVLVRGLPPSAAERAACVEAWQDAESCRAYLARAVWSDSLAGGE